MVLITIVTGAYKPTNITGGGHIVHMGQKWSQPVESPCIRINIAGIYGVDAAVAVAPSH